MAVVLSQTDIHAHETGYIKELPVRMENFAMQLGAGRATKSDSLNYETGIVFEKKVGDSDSGRPYCQGL